MFSQVGEVALKMATEIPYAEFMADYEAGLIHDINQIGARIYGKSVKGQADNPRGYIMVYAGIPEVIPEEEEAGLIDRIKKILHL